MEKRILIISHNAERAGAPVLLLHLATALRNVLGWKTDFLLKYDGPLRAEFSKLGNVFIYAKTPSDIRQRILARVNNKLRTDLHKIPFDDYDLVLSNTIANGDILPLIKERFKGPLISYIHELKAVKNHVTKPEDVSNVFKYSNLILVPGTAVKNYLQSEFELREELIRIFPYYIPPFSDKYEKSVVDTTFTVGGCGSVEIRKGTDLFVLIAKLFVDKYPEVPVRFIWKGADLKKFDCQLLLEDIRKLGLEGVVEIQAADKEIELFYKSLDVFVLPSREDPYPLVVLEAANAMLPIICFENSGGAPEFVSNDAGRKISYLNINEMMEAIYDYYIHKDIRLRNGEIAYLRLKEKHQDEKMIANLFESMVAKVR